ncbi:acyltransferase family protein [Desulfovibrio oxyclinae]|uniref:acyltransferase family protein n=1 Tax=Desulfovibrio oxyclinae TaxID=63560 RepID=UPI00039A2CAB|nr:acyltransferase [Desulfovibrio oxyclinae]
MSPSDVKTGYNPFVQYVKLLFLALVVWGHVYHGSRGVIMYNFWIPVDTGLCFFAITSGFFIARRYPPGADMRIYWRNKVRRLFVVYLIVNLFLAALFVVQGRPDILGWHSLVSWLGMSGFLNWFHINNQSPFGLGVWFLTLLLIFYVLFPLFNGMLTHPGVLDTLLVGGFAATLILPETNPYGVALWSTAYGYVVGIYMARRGLQLRPGVGVALLAAGVLAGVVIKGLSLGYGAYGVISLLGAGIALFVLGTAKSYRMPWLDAVGDVLLPVYIIHQYFQVTWWDSPVVNGLFALTASFLVGKGLAVAGKKCGELLDGIGTGRASVRP